MTRRLEDRLGQDLRPVDLKHPVPLDYHPPPQSHQVIPHRHAEGPIIPEAGWRVRVAICRLEEEALLLGQASYIIERHRRRNAGSCLDICYPRGTEAVRPVISLQ